MMRLELKKVAEITGGRLEGTDAVIQGLVHDTRQAAPGCLFAALPGSRVHGHDFLEDALAAGAVGALVSAHQDVAISQVVVEDVQSAMGALAAFWRRQMPAQVVGITGSNGKTTVKEMLSSILCRQGPTLSTKGNYNNEIGLPLTIARMAPDHEFAVLEMGASRPGDIARLASIAAPIVGIVTNAAPAHLAGFGDLEGVARAKGELFAALGADATAIINRDDPHFDLWSKLAGKARRITFGVHDQATVRLTNGSGHTVIETPAGRLEVKLAIPGRHNQLNALAATAAALALGIAPDTITAGLEGVSSLPGRLERHHSEAGWCLIDDTYNANPASLYAGLSVLAGLEGERWLVLGDMAELGPDSIKLHGEMGQTARDLGVVRLYAIGDAARASARSFGESARHFERREDLVRALKSELRPGVNCLVKGSRSMEMEQVVRLLIGRAA